MCCTVYFNKNYIYLFLRDDEVKMNDNKEFVQICNEALNPLI